MKTILIADDEPSLQKILADTLYGFNKTIICVADGAEALHILNTQPVDLAFLDIRMPKMNGLEVLSKRERFYKKTPVIIITAQDNMANAVEAMKLGAFDYLAKPFDLDAITALADLALKDVVQPTNNVSGATSHDNLMIGQSLAMREIYKTIGKVGPQNITVLILGESGTGKELVAKSLHHHSPRANKPFVAVNCAAIPGDILESELFGHRKGAFTGAIEDKKGYFEQADGGTIFLDEISEMPPALQTKLLRFLQDLQLQKVGGTETKSIDVRVIAASNRDLQNEIENGRFRADLYFRLNVIPIAMPPLRERREDIPRLIHHFLSKHMVRLGLNEKRLSHDAVQHLCRHNWPGNVRELENIIMRLLVLSPTQEISSAQVQILLNPNTITKQKNLEDIITHALSPLLDAEASPKNLLDQYLPWIEKPLIEVALKRVGGNQIAAAEILGIHRNTLRKKIKELGIHGR